MKLISYFVYMWFKQCIRTKKKLLACIQYSPTPQDLIYFILLYYIPKKTEKFQKFSKNHFFFSTYYRIGTVFNHLNWNIFWAHIKEKNHHSTLWQYLTSGSIELIWIVYIFHNMMAITATNKCDSVAVIGAGRAYSRYIGR